VRLAPRRLLPAADFAPSAAASTGSLPLCSGHSAGQRPETRSAPAGRQQSPERAAQHRPTRPARVLAVPEAAPQAASLASNLVPFIRSTSNTPCLVLRAAAGATQPEAARGPLRSGRLHPRPAHARSGRAAEAQHVTPPLDEGGGTEAQFGPGPAPNVRREWRSKDSHGVAEPDYLTYLRHTNGKAGASLLAARAREGPRMSARRGALCRRRSGRPPASARSGPERAAA
jgi:hypothetical protein